MKYNLFLWEGGKGDFTVISRLDWYVILGPVEFSVYNGEAFSGEEKNDFTESHLSIFLKLRYVDKISFLNIIFVDEYDSSTLFGSEGWIMTELIIVDTHRLKCGFN